MDVLIPDWPGLPPNVRAFTTFRSRGASRAPFDDGKGGGGFNVAQHVGDDPEAVAANRRILRAELPDEPFWLNQVHGIDVADAALPLPSSGSPQADASVAATAGRICAIMTADCLPVLFVDDGGRVVGAAHAGWRGLLGGVLGATVDAMRQRGAGEISAWLGPAIGPQAFEVGPEVRTAFVDADGDAVQAFRDAAEPDKYLTDIYALARIALRRAGVVRVHGGAWCTVEDTERFYSYRRDGRTGRMASLIWRERREG